jgi:NAD(P)-dependent dehydrogenase (short-subunit alcohol dehydrogenase family)
MTQLPSPTPATGMTGLRGRVALVTGAGRNIGRAVALALAAAGADVAVNVRSNAEEAGAVALAAEELGVRASPIVGDVSDPAECGRLVDAAQRSLGPVDVLVHCVGTRPRLLLQETSIDEWRRVMDTNCTSYFSLAKQVLPVMAERNFGRLIAISGPDAYHAHARHGSVAASKHALSALTQTVALEYGQSGITANMVSPTITETTESRLLTPEVLGELLAIPRVGRLEEIAFACVYLASDQASYITGQTIRVDGGFEL